ncbi:aminotransferase class I/II-fold pyridoxal phosphate-dependent enzyme [Cryptosporangium arvum]|uniref:aminotransferase class I/II-fold pyridoxal phosphate-dependent enzyme n=1 Tax=Cryptosporangium arvum TaxID=80871 RepID=UPI0004B870EA|nr:aminotransferase class I/II-fold pyridoxal phosphate-dependent enzyme [Cryptosporangium arvum]
MHVRSTVTDPLQRLRDAYSVRTVSGHTRRLRPRSASGDGLVDLAGSDYLGLSADERVVSAAAASALTWGAGSTGSRLVTGTTVLHADLEAALARFCGAPDALVFSSDYLAGLAAVATLGGADVLLVSDAVNHASYVDACRLTRSRVTVTPHRDVAAVERALAGRPEEHAVVLTDALFGVEGDLAPLPELHGVCRRHGALLVVNEAHALGVVGDRGRGAAYAAGLAGEPDVVRTLTLAKSLGSQGGAVLGAPEVIQELIDRGRPFAFDTGLAPASAAAALTALRILSSTPELVAAVRARASELAWAARSAGLLVTRPDGAVLTVRVGDAGDALHAQQIFAEFGFDVGCLRPPTIPDGRACLRLTAKATLSDADVARAARAFTAVSRSLGTPSRH